MMEMAGPRRVLVLESSGGNGGPLAIALSSDGTFVPVHPREVGPVEQIRGGLDAVVIDLETTGDAETIVRGLAYYTGIVFELFDAQGEFRAICGGGRYDTLLASLGGVDLPALGFGMGDVVLGELLKARGKLPATARALDYWVAFEDESRLARAMQIATALRRQGKAVEYALHGVQLGKQLKAASSAGAGHAVILRQDGKEVLRDLASGAEKPFTLSDG